MRAMLARTSLILSLAVVVVALSAGPAGAATSCSFSAASLQIVHTSGIDDITISRNGTAIEVREGTTLLSCGGPTVNVTQTISYDNQNGISNLILIEPDALSPGVGPELDAPEIEVAVSETGGILSTFEIRDGDGGGDVYAAGVNGINANGDGDVDITFFSTSAGVEWTGGLGNDSFDGRGGGILGAAFPQRLTLAGGAGADGLFGGAATDDVDGGPGDDVLDGGGNTDELSYEESTAPVAIDLAASGPQNGGSLGADTIGGFEELVGSNHNDILRGTDGENDVIGRRGDDLIEGRGGTDFLEGDAGVDTVSYEGAAAPVNVDLAIADDLQDTGGAGMDFLFDADVENLIGSAGADNLRGTNGVNRIDGGGGPDTIAALGGDDTVQARDGAGDTVDCGDGADGGSFDRRSLDTAITSCELAVFAAEPDTTVRPRLRGKAQKLRGRAIAVRAGCGAEVCTLTATASVNVPNAAKRLRFGRVRTRVAAGQTKVLRLKLKPGAARSVLRALRAGRRLSVRVSLTAVDAAGNRARRSLSLRLQR